MSTRRAEAREIRGRILKILDLDYPHEVSDRIISLTLNDINYNVNPAILAGYLAYLEDKGYVECRKVESRDLQVTLTLVKLTPKGKDLREGNIPPDPGVSI